MGSVEFDYLQWASGQEIQDQTIPWQRIDHPDYPDKIVEVGGINFNETINEDAIARTFSHRNGIFKNSPMRALRSVFLNQADLPEDRAAGQRIAKLLLKDSGAEIKRVVLGQLTAESPVYEIFDPIHTSPL